MSLSILRPRPRAGLQHQNVKADQELGDHREGVSHCMPTRCLTMPYHQEQIRKSI